MQMNYGIIDLGSNSIRLSVYSNEDGNINTVLTKKEIAGLSHYVKNGVMDMSGILRACEIITGFKDIAYKFCEPKDLHIFSTASIRGIKNKNEALELIQKNTGLLPEVLEGEEEARLDFIGAQKLFSCRNGLMVDIGGASTELVLFNMGSIVNVTSLPIGCLNLYVNHVDFIMPGKDERKIIKGEIRKHLDSIDWEIPEEYPIMLGVGGTLRAALKLSGVINPDGVNIAGCEFQAESVDMIISRLKKHSKEIVTIVYKTAPERLLTITTGLILLREIIRKFNIHSITVSKYGVKEGYLIDRILNRENTACEGNS